VKNSNVYLIGFWVPWNISFVIRMTLVWYLCVFLYGRREWCVFLVGNKVFLC